jgi:hypothetical protein
MSASSYDEDCFLILPSTYLFMTVQNALSLNVQAKETSHAEYWVWMCDCSLKSNNSVPSCNTPKSIMLFLKLFVATVSRYQNLLLKLKLK